MSEIAQTPNPPYYAVIFTSIQTEGDDGYSEMAERMEERLRFSRHFYQQRRQGTK